MVTCQSGIAGAAKKDRLSISRPRSRRESSTKGVLLIGSDFQAVGVCRALAQQKVPTFLLETEVGIARYSRHVHRRAAKHDLLTANDSVDYLLNLAEKQSLAGWVVFCVDDETVEFLAKNHPRLSEAFVLSVLPWETTRKFFEKDRASDLVRRCGVQVPTVYPSSSLNELLAAEIRYPVVLKPTFKKTITTRRKKSCLCL